jgi:glutamine synthetase
MAMIDGIKNKTDPGEALDKNIYDMASEELQNVNSTCANLEEALDEMSNNRAFLTAGDVFSDDLIDAYIDFKKQEEIEPMKLFPSALEYKLYYSL